MDWARDGAGVSEQDLNNVFRYEEKDTTVVCLYDGTEVRFLFSCNTLRKLIEPLLSL